MAAAVVAVTDHKKVVDVQTQNNPKPTSLFVTMTDCLLLKVGGELDIKWLHDHYLITMSADALTNSNIFIACGWSYSITGIDTHSTADFSRVSWEGRRNAEVYNADLYLPNPIIVYHKWPRPSKLSSARSD